jgi:PEP-CTERM motif
MKVLSRSNCRFANSTGERCEGRSPRSAGGALTCPWISPVPHGQMIKPLAHPWLVALVGSLLLSLTTLCHADATGNISSGNWFVKNSSTGTDSVWFGTLGWAASANIIWTAGADDINGTVYPSTSSSETKFIPGGLLTGKVFVGHVQTDTAAAGKFITDTGAGSSKVGVAFYSASWNVSVVQTGLVKGTDTWTANMVGRDPWAISPADLAGLGSTYSVYIPLTIGGGSSEANDSSFISGNSFNVTYETASGLDTLLDVTVRGDHATVTASPNYSSSQLKFFLQSGPEVAPSGSSTPGTLISRADLETLVNSDISASLSLMSPIHLAVVLDGVAKPTALLSDGSVANTGASARAFESAIPEPASLVLLALGLASLMAFRRTRRRTGRIGQLQ